jgi:hypothetical protein
MALVSVTCSIAAGQSLSNGVVLTAGRLVRIRTPSAWKPANITFQCASADVPAQYRDVYNRFGGRDRHRLGAAQHRHRLPSEVTAWLQDAWIKIRSGHAGIDVPQLSQCDFELVLFK